MARKANLVQKLKSADPFVLQVDAGDLLFSTLNPPALLVEQNELQAKYLLRTMDALNHDVVVPGEKDFALGVKVFEKLIGNSKIHFIAANLKRKNGKPFLSDHWIVSGETTSGQKIQVGIFGVVGGDLDWPKELKVTSARIAAKKQVLSLQGKVNYIIALTHQGLEKDQELAKQVPGIDLIVGGHSQSFLQKPVQIGKTWIVQSSFRNQYLGVFPLASPLNADAYELIGLDPGYESPSPGPVDLLVREFKQAVADLNSRQEEDSTRLQATAGVASEKTEKKFQTFSQCASCHLKQFDFWRKTQHFQSLQTLLGKQQARNKECMSCHTVGLGDAQGFQNVNRLADWNVADIPSPTSSPSPAIAANAPPIAASQSSGPAESALSYATPEQLGVFLKSIREAPSVSASIDPLGHPLGVSGPIPPVPMKLALQKVTHSWAPVQCENCHLPGRGHPFNGSYSKTVQNTVCTSCHTPERAPQWYSSSGQLDLKVVEAKRSLITCPAGDLSEQED
jgi:hypothetical protein